MESSGADVDRAKASEASHSQSGDATESRESGHHGPSTSTSGSKSGEKRSREEYSYDQRSSSRHRYRDEKRRNYGDDGYKSHHSSRHESSRHDYERSSRRHSRRSSRERKTSKDRYDHHSRRSDHRYKDHESKKSTENGNSSSASAVATVPATTDDATLPTAPAAFYQQQQQQPQQQQQQQPAAAAAAAAPATAAQQWDYYGKQEDQQWTAQQWSDYHSSQQAYHDYHYYYRHDPASAAYYQSYYQQNPGYYAPRTATTPQQPTAVPPPPPPPPPPPSQPNVPEQAPRPWQQQQQPYPDALKIPDNGRSRSSPQQLVASPERIESKDRRLPQLLSPTHTGGVPDSVLDDVGYPSRTEDDPSTLFEKIGQVGEGNYGKVYKARNCKTGNLMALKRIRMKNDKDGFPITAMREIKLLQRLKHERIVELQQIMVARGSVYMVMEYMDHDLSGILSHPNFTFQPAHAKFLVRQMLEGLGYLHQMGILHRDIKGSNLLVNNKGELKIADFGLARAFQKNASNDYTNRVITLWYRPPELLLGATAYGPAVDIWSVGCIVIEFFARKPAFNGVDEISQLDLIYRTMGTPTLETWPTVNQLPWYELVRPKEQYPNRFKEIYQSMLSPGAVSLLEAMLSMDPQRRPTAAEALEFDYFTKEEPAAVAPENLLDIHGDWHEFESKQRKRATKAQSVPEVSNASSRTAKKA